MTLEVYETCEWKTAKYPNCPVKPMELSPETKEAIRIHSGGFKTYLQGDEGKDTIAGIGEGTELLRKLLAEDKLSTLSEADFSSAVMHLWAMNFWKNKQYKIDQLLKDNGIAVLREELRNLLFGDLPIGRRYDQFRKNVKGFGPAMITEILITMFPGKYSLESEADQRSSLSEDGHSHTRSRFQTGTHGCRICEMHRRDATLMGGTETERSH